MSDRSSVGAADGESVQAALNSKQAPVSAYMERLPRRLGFWSALCAAVGMMIGSGIFRVPSGVAASVESTVPIIMLWVIGGLFALLGAACFAELGAIYPRPGGLYVFMREIWGPLPAFLYGWTQIFITRPASLGAIALIFAGYFGAFVPLSPTGERWVACGVIALLGVVNYRSVLWGSAVVNSTTWAKVAGLLAFVAIAFWLGSGSAGALKETSSLAPSSWGAFGVALITVMFSYSGWAGTTHLGGEIKDPGKNLPRALVGGVIIVMVIYILVNLAYLYVMPVDEMAGSSLVAADVATRVVGPVGARLVAALVMVSTFGALSVLMLRGPRSFFAMAEDGQLFRIVAAVHPHYQTPYVATLLTAGVGIWYLSFRSFEELAQSMILGAWPFYAASALGIIVLRRRYPELQRPYQSFAYPLAPVLFLAGSAVMLLNALVQETGLMLFGLGVMAIGAGVFYAIHGSHQLHAGRQNVMVRLSGFVCASGLVVAFLLLGSSDPEALAGSATPATDDAGEALEATRVQDETSFPPRLPEGQRIVTDRSEQMLVPPDTLREGVSIAETPPTVDFLYLPGQDYPGKPWSAWGDSLAVGGKYYVSIGDHLGPEGNAFLYEYDPESKRFRQLLDVRALLQVPEGQYTPGKIHSRIDLGSDGWLYLATHRGSSRWTTDEYGFEGDWILRVHPGTGKAEVVVHAPVSKHALPTGILDPARMIFYAGTAAGEDSEDEGIQFLAYDIRERRVLYTGPDGPNRQVMLARSTGRAYYTQGRDGKYGDTPLMRYDPALGAGPVEIEGEIGIRAATLETPQGVIYAASMARRGEDSLLYAFHVESESVELVGSAPVATQTYVATLDADPSGRYLYYIPGAHGGSHEDGSAIVQFDTRTGRKRVIAFLHPFYEERYGAVLKGTYSLAVDPAGDKLYVAWNVSRGSRAWDSVALAVVHIPASERR